MTSQQTKINKQATISCKTMQKQRYTFGHLSLIQNLALDIPSGVATMRDRKTWVLSKKRFGYFLVHLSFWASGVKLPLIFYTKNKKN